MASSQSVSPARVYGADTPSWASNSASPSAARAQYGGYLIPPSNYTTVHKVHAALAAAAFLLFFPLGGIAIRMLKVQHVAWVHAGIQMFAYTLFIAAAGCGIWMSKEVGVIGRYHPVIGFILIALMALQPIPALLEMMYPNFYARFPKAICLSHMHIWLGRLLITVGIVNGGLGFMFADSIPGPKWGHRPRVAYGIVATVVWLAYVAVVILWQQGKTGRKGSAGSGLSNELEGLRGERVEDGPGPGPVEGHGNNLSQHRDFRSSAL